MKKRNTVNQKIDKREGTLPVVKPILHLILLTEKEVSDADLLDSYFKDALSIVKNNGESYDVQKYHLISSNCDIGIQHALEPMSKLLGEHFLCSPPNEMISASFIARVIHIANLLKTQGDSDLDATALA